jgi:hypothetical protein
VFGADWGAGLAPAGEKTRAAWESGAFLAACGLAVGAVLGAIAGSIFRAARKGQ